MSKGRFGALILAGILLLLIFNQELTNKVFQIIFPSQESFLYPEASILQLFLEHLEMAGIATLACIVLGFGIGLFALTTSGEEFQEILVNISSIAQTFPSAGIIALAVPVIGFGVKPVVLALAVYGILPVMLNVITGITSVPDDIVEAARGMGMREQQILFKIKIPLAFPVILAGIKNAAIINVSAATLGATVGAGGLGVPILAGIQKYNPAYILEGALPAALLAIVIDQLFGEKDG